MFDSDNEVYFSNYNFPSIQIRKPKKKRWQKNYLFQQEIL